MSHWTADHRPVVENFRKMKVGRVKSESVNILMIGVVALCALQQIITVKDFKRRLSLCSSEDSEADEPEFQEEGDDVLPVLGNQSQLLDDYHLKRVRMLTGNISK